MCICVYVCVRERERERKKRNLYMGAVISALIIVRVTDSALHAARARYPWLLPVYWEEPGDDAQTISSINLQQQLNWKAIFGLCGPRQQNVKNH